MGYFGANKQDDDKACGLLVLTLQPGKLSPRGVLFWREFGNPWGQAVPAVPFVGRSPVLAQQNELPQKSSRAAPFLLSGGTSGFMAVVVRGAQLALQPLLHQQQGS